MDVIDTKLFHLHRIFKNGVGGGGGGRGGSSELPEPPLDPPLTTKMYDLIAMKLPFANLKNGFGWVALCTIYRK